MTLADTYTAVPEWFRLTHVVLPDAWMDMVSEYRTLKGSGHTRNEILAALAATPRSLPVTQSQYGALVTAMERVESGIPIQNPTEAPSWAEAYDMGLGKLDIPWGKIALFALAYFAVTQGLPNLLKK